MRKTRIGLGVTIGVSALSWALAPGVTAQAVHDSTQLRAASGPAARAHVVDVTSPAQLPPGGGSSSGGSAAGSATPNITYRTSAFTNNDGGECLDGDTNTIPNNGAKVQLWGCNGWTNQKWYWTGSTLQNADGWECLDGDTNTIPNNGAKVQLWGCNGWTNQNWTFH